MAKRYVQAHSVDTASQGAGHAFELGLGFSKRKEGQSRPASQDVHAHGQEEQGGKPRGIGPQEEEGGSDAKSDEI